MRIGATISGAAHLGLIAAVLLGLPDSPVEARLNVPQVSNVSLISAADFDAQRSDAPDQPETEVASLAVPVEEPPAEEVSAEEAAPEVPDTPQPDPPTVEQAPVAPVTDLPDPEVATVVTRPDPAPIGEDSPLMAGPEADGSVNSTTQSLDAPDVPNLAPRIDTTAAPKPPEEAKEAETVQEETAPSEDAAPVEEEVEVATAPEEATTEIAPDAEETENPLTLSAATRPPGRHPALVDAAEEEKKRAEEEAIAAAIAKAAEDDLQQQPAPDPEPVADATGSRIGAGFSGSEKRAIGDVIGKVWNKGPITGKAGFEDLVVIVRVRLTASGEMMGKVEPVQPSNPTGDFAIAFRQARIAVTRAVGAGLPLPTDKFRDGDYLEIRFDPSRDAVSFE